MLFDTHCHLDTPAFDADREAALVRARQAGVSRFLNPGYDLASSQRAVELAQRHPNVYAAVGVHPNDAREFAAETLDQLRALATQPKVVAIGEIGLDYYWKTVPPQRQAEAFVAQLELARALDLPVIIHCRDAYDDCLALLERHGRDLSVVMHAFGGELSHLWRALDLGCTIGIGGPVTYPKAQRLREVAASVPLDRLVLETDAPYLSPQPHRGKRNEPAFLPLAAAVVADVRRMRIEDLARATGDNSVRLFRLEQTHE